MAKKYEMNYDRMTCFADGTDDDAGREYVKAEDYDAVFDALKNLRSFMWSEGYADQTLEMAEADSVLAD